MANNILGNSAMATAIEAQQQWLVPKLLSDLKAQNVQRGSTVELLIAGLMGYGWVDTGYYG